MHLQNRSARALAGALVGSLFALPFVFGLASNTPRTALAGEEETTPTESYEEAAKRVKGLRKTPGEAGPKERAVRLLALHPGATTAELLFDWYIDSVEWSEEELIPLAKESLEKFQKYESMLIKSKVPLPPKNAEQANAYQALLKASREAQTHVDAEAYTRKWIEEAIARATCPHIAAWIAGPGMESLGAKKVRKLPLDGLRTAGAMALTLQPIAHVKGAMLALAGPTAPPRVQSLLFLHLARGKVAEGLPLIAKGIEGSHPLVLRGAVFALEAYDDPRAVEHLIRALNKADPLLTEEIEVILHWYTGQSFQGVASLWGRWWKEQGEAWLAGPEATKRHPALEMEVAGTGARATFYDIPTESKAIVFVLDRSGSMKEPAGEKAQERKEDEKKGPTTGGGGSKKGKEGEEEPIAGGNRLEVAINKLEQSVSQLPKDVRFSLVFFSTTVTTWQDPPKMELPTPKNKEAAIAWFKELKPDGATSLFLALMKALEYADAGSDPKAVARGEGGANTIFLLSDGTPTAPGGTEKMTPEQIEVELAAFLRANESSHCVVHTIGVGPGHDRTLMQRIAAATKGVYRAVGVE